ncbi:MAG: hypothetical protein LBI10_07115 [Deltaproteobacteria bacterium]|nr:hypothetical protein [Deltaproteobacteria bacterium]
MRTKCCIFVVIILALLTATLRIGPFTPTLGADEGEGVAPPISREDFFKKAGGLILDFGVWPQDSKYSESELKPDGSYLYAESLDSLVYIRLRRNAPTQATDLGQIAALFQEEGGEKPKVTQDAKLSAKLTYPVYKATFNVGSNEDTVTMRALYVGVDSWDLLINISTAADFYEEYEARINEWLESVTLKDLNEK